MQRLFGAFPAVSLIILALFLLMPETARAVPSFARQTGADCSACHTVFLELTPFGRSFKLHGYTMTNVTQGQTSGLKENYYPPVSAMMLVSMTKTNEGQPGTQNGNVLFPEALSLFYAGRISDKLGAYAQVTYSQPDDHFSMDNADIRFADEIKDLVYGLTFNNNPTVQDLWNSTPAWGFPFVASAVAPGPAASTQLAGTNAQQVAGLGVFGYWKDFLYGEVTFYKSSQVGGNQPPTSPVPGPNGLADSNVVDGTAPYWRLAAETNWGDHSLAIGTYGMDVKKFPGGAAVPPAALNGPTNHFTDYAVDSQYQYITEPHIVTAHATWIFETQDWNASFPLANTSNATDRLTTFKVDSTYYYRRTVGGSLGYFSTRGTIDALLYPAGDVNGSATGSPDSSGWVVEADYLPWLNTKFVVQYTFYDKFNGATSNYDGAGRRATDNNTLYIAAWLMF